ncbi:nuclease-related domain-containing protein [Lysinibacillus sp. LZ02]|uniref:nuclease-related domain-containing protein n=1 Tax=Lysinibacillus sp. LZ02 TaxID=3420668 RepID=UPI003D35BF52
MFKQFMKKVKNTIDSHKDYRNATGNSLLDVVTNKGLFGEYLSNFALNDVQGTSRTLYNIYIPKKNGKPTEIDLVFIHETGIYAIESKNYSAWIYGNGDHKNWTQVFPNRKKYSFYNPIKQNETHIRALQHVLPNISTEAYTNLVVFSERCELKEIHYTQQQTHVIKRPALRKLIEELTNKNPNMFTTAEVIKIYTDLKRFAVTDPAIIEQHKQDIAKYKK